MPEILPKYILKTARKDAETLSKKLNVRKLIPPKYNNISYYKDLTRKEYFDALVLLRHYIKIASDVYFSEIVGARNTDLFMLTTSVSSPMGPGSDSEAISIKFGKFKSYLVDSSQFGFEPLLFQNNDAVYCYLPSMRGEKPDTRHLNQFFHCEAEIVGTLEKLIPIIERYVKALAEIIIALEPIVSRMSLNYPKSKVMLLNIIRAKHFKKLSFDDAYKALQKSEQPNKYIKNGKFGRIINSEGEKFLSKTFAASEPLWIYGFDRDVVAFYQKPNPKNKNIVVNADLLFPPITKNGFGGEIVGSGQRQDSVIEIRESLTRQHLKSKPYDWYIDLRKQSGYKATSGFGLGIERFIAWSLGYKNIQDVILYPRLKNIKTTP